MDSEDFQIWKESTATQWVLQRLAQQSDAIKTDLSEQLFYGTGNSPEEWAAMQARAAFDRGRVAGVNSLVALTFEEINDGDGKADQS